MKKSDGRQDPKKAWFGAGSGFLTKFIPFKIVL